jgi:hypothetical protein
MRTKPDQEKSCVQNLLHRVTPTTDWPLNELADLAQSLHQAISRRERSVAGLYWRLGQALSLARPGFPHGQWGEFLTSLQIRKPRAAKAVAIFHAFATAEAVAALTVDAAYAQRKRKTCRRRHLTPVPIRGPAKGPMLAAYLRELRRVARRWVEAASATQESEARELLVILDDVLTAMGTMRDRLSMLCDPGGSSSPSAPRGDVIKVDVCDFTHDRPAVPTRTLEPAVRLPS